MRHIIKLATIALGLVLCAVRGIPEPQIPVPAGSPITVGSGATRFVPTPSTAAPLFCSSLLVQAGTANTGLIYILNAAPSVTMALNGTGTTTVAILGAPSSATVTPPSFTFPSNSSTTNASGGFDLRLWGVAGSVSADTVIASCDLRN